MPGSKTKGDTVSNSEMECDTREKHMSLSGVNNSNSVSVQDPQTLAGPWSNARLRGNWHHRHHYSDGGDSYSPSTDQGQGASALGTYSVSQIDIFAVIARVSVLQGTSTPDGQSVASSASSSSPNSTQPADANSPSTSPVQQAADGAAPSTAGSIATTSNDSTAAASPDPSQSQDPFQALNQALASLGFNQQEIQAFDQVASLINAISPSAFSQIVSTLQQLAQQSAQAPAASSANPQVAEPSSTSNADVTPSTTTSSSATAGTGQTTNSSGSGLQIEEIAIQFQAESITGSLNSKQSSDSQSGSARWEASAFSLQVEELNVTLA